MNNLAIIRKIHVCFWDPCGEDCGKIDSFGSLLPKVLFLHCAYKFGFSGVLAKIFGDIYNLWVANTKLLVRPRLGHGYK